MTGRKQCKGAGGKPPKPYHRKWYKLWYRCGDSTFHLQGKKERMPAVQVVFMLAGEIVLAILFILLAIYISFY